MPGLSLAARPWLEPSTHAHARTHTRMDARTHTHTHTHAHTHMHASLQHASKPHPLRHTDLPTLNQRPTLLSALAAQQTRELPPGGQGDCCTFGQLRITVVVSSDGSLVHIHATRAQHCLEVQAQPHVLTAYLHPAVHSQEVIMRRLLSADAPLADIEKQRLLSWLNTNRSRGVPLPFSRPALSSSSMARWTGFPGH